MVSIALILCLFDLILGFSAMFKGFLFLPAIILSVATLIVLVIGRILYGDMKKPLCDTCINKNNCNRCTDRIKALQLVFSKINISLCIMDIFVGILAYILLSVQDVTSAAISFNILKTVKVAINGTSSKIQLQRLRQFYLMQQQTKKRRKANMKRFLKWVFISNPKTHMAIITILGSVALGLIHMLGAVDWGIVTPIVSGALGVLGTMIAAWAGLESNTTADARKVVEKEVIEIAKAEKVKLLKKAKTIVETKTSSNDDVRVG